MGFMETLIFFILGCIIIGLIIVLFMNLVAWFIGLFNNNSSDDGQHSSTPEAEKSAPTKKSLDEISESNHILKARNHISSDFLDLFEESFVTKKQIGEETPWVGEEPSWVGEELSRVEIPPWITEKLFYEEAPPWMVDNEFGTIKELFERYGVTSLWHMTHVYNIESILKRGILSNTQAYNDLKPFDISDHGVQKWREATDPIYRRSLHDYVPTYLNIKNPMLFVKRDIQNKICLLELSLSILSEKSFLFTNGNAAAKNTTFYNSVHELERLPWDVLNAKYWNDFEDGKRKRCAEVLVYPNIPPKYIKKIHCSSYDTLKRLSDLPVQSVISEELFFNNHQTVNKSFDDDIPF